MGSYVTLPSIGADMLIYGELDSPDMRHFNSSIAWHKGKLKIAIRSCNFAISQQGHFYFRDGSAYSKTDVIYGDVDPDTLQVSNLEKLDLVDAPTRTLVSGLEDARLFSRKDGMYVIGFESDRLTRSLHNASARMAEYIVEGNELKYIRTLEKPRTEIPEKNWCPSDVASDEFDFTYSDTEVWKDGRVFGEPTRTQIHGGSQLLKQKDGTYLSIVHDKVSNPRQRMVYDRFIYRHYLARHGKDGIITDITSPFTFGTHENIEFAAGMVEHNDNFLISFGVRDCKYGIARVSKQKLVDMLEAKV